jgi:hypothetical protein
MYVPIGCPGCNEQLYVPLSLFQSAVLCPVCHRCVSVGVTDPRGRAAAASGPPAVQPAAVPARAADADLDIPEDIPLAERYVPVRNEVEEIPVIDLEEVEPADEAEPGDVEPVEAEFIEDENVAPAQQPTISDQVAACDIDKILVVLKRELKSGKERQGWDLVDGRHVPQRVRRRRQRPGRGRQPIPPLLKPKRPPESLRLFMLLVVLLFWSLPLWALVRPGGGTTTHRLTEMGLWAGVALALSGVGLLLAFVRWGPQLVRLTIGVVLLVGGFTLFFHLGSRGGLSAWLLDGDTPWQEYRFSDASFQANFPQPPRKDREAILEDVGDGAWLDGTCYAAETESPKSRYSVTRIRFLREPNQPLSVEQRLQLVKTWFVRSAKGQLADEEETTIAGRKGKRLVLTFNGDAPHRRVEVRMVAANGMYFILQAHDAADRDQQRFFSSFRVLED